MTDVPVAVRVGGGLIDLVGVRLVLVGVRVIGRARLLVNVSVGEGDLVGVWDSEFDNDGESVRDNEDARTI